ncbi:MAG: helix-turn-helix domain-containing protein [bacterium]
MKCFSKELQSLGMRLRTMRLRRNESQAILAARLGVSVPTLRKMEGGSSSVLIGHWVAALEILDRVGDLETVLAEPEDLFKRMEQMERPMPLRASRKKS